MAKPLSFETQNVKLLSFKNSPAAVKIVLSLKAIVMILYGIPNCNTVKKARDWLDTHGISYTFHDFKKAGVSETLLKNWLTQYAHTDLINRAGLTWRGLSDIEKSAVIGNASAIVLMQTKTSLIKRPILEKDSKIIALGFNETHYLELLKWPKL